MLWGGVTPGVMLWGECYTGCHAMGRLCPRVSFYAAFVTHGVMLWGTSDPARVSSGTTRVTQQGLVNETRLTQSIVRYLVCDL